MCMLRILQKGSFSAHRRKGQRTGDWIRQRWEGKGTFGNKLLTHICFDIRLPTCYVRLQLASAGTRYYPKYWHTACGGTWSVAQNHWCIFCLQQKSQFKCCIFFSSFTTEHIGLFSRDKKKEVSSICKWFNYPTSFHLSAKKIQLLLTCFRR